MLNKLRILFIAPLPPPIDGQSKASEQALLALKADGHEIFTVNTYRRRGLSLSRFSRLYRILELPRLFLRVLRGRRNVDAIYMSLSESFWGNIKDIATYVFLLGKLDKLTIHMLGGTSMGYILKRGSFLSLLNRLFMNRMRGVIVEGRRGLKIFGEHFDEGRIKIVPNFFDEYLLVEDYKVHKKFNDEKPLQILYLSNMILEKGYLDLLDGFLSLPVEIRSKFRLKFVGGFPEASDKNLFLKRIKPESDVEYLGSFIDGEAKKTLYLSSQIFCLPTYYPFEGQPISILEAYATGCVVVTTQHGGIPDIFIEGENGFFVDLNNPASICSVLSKASLDSSNLNRIAINNAMEAVIKYRCDRYRRDINYAITR